MLSCVYVLICKCITLLMRSICLSFLIFVWSVGWMVFCRFNICWLQIYKTIPPHVAPNSRTSESALSLYIFILFFYHLRYTAEDAMLEDFLGDAVQYRPSYWVIFQCFGLDHFILCPNKIQLRAYFPLLYLEVGWKNFYEEGIAQ